MDLTAVFLDAGGVIIDETDHERIRAEITVELLRSVVADYKMANYWSDVEDAVRAYCPEVYQYVFFKHLKHDAWLFQMLYSNHQALWQERRSPPVLNEGIADEIRQLSHDFRIGIAGQYGVEILALLEKHRLLDCFTWRVTQDDFTITKPDPRYLDRILAACEVSPGEAVMVGDRIDKDVVPARQVGMKTLLIRRGIHKNQKPRIPSDRPDVELTQIAGLAAAVATLQ